MTSTEYTARQGPTKRFRLILRESGNIREMGGEEMSLAVGIVDNIFMNALDTGTSDIHLQPEREQLTLLLDSGELRNVDLGAVTLSLNWQYLGLAVVVVGLQFSLMGVVAQTLFDYTGRRRRRWLRLFPYTRTVLIAMGLALVVVIPGRPTGVGPESMNNGLSRMGANLCSWIPGSRL